MTSWRRWQRQKRTGSGAVGTHAVTVVLVDVIQHLQTIATSHVRVQQHSMTDYVCNNGAVDSSSTSVPEM